MPFSYFETLVKLTDKKNSVFLFVFVLNLFLFLTFPVSLNCDVRRTMLRRVWIDRELDCDGKRDRWN